MPVYHFKAMDSSGKEKKGKMEAADEKSVADVLKNQGMFPTSINTAKGSKNEKSKAAPVEKNENSSGLKLNMAIGPVVIKKRELTILTRQLAILLDAGLPLIRSLRTLEQQSKNPAVRKVLGDASMAVESGSTFSEALSQHPRIFNKLYLNMVKAGEAAGAMEKILNRLAGFMEKSTRMAGKVKSAMVYPSVVLAVAVSITSGLMLFVVPKFKVIFEGFLGDASLPSLTEFVCGVSEMMKTHSLEGFGIIFLIVVLYKLMGISKTGKYAQDWVKYHLPLFGPIIAKSAIARFSQTLGTLMATGVPVLNALQIVKETSGNEVVADGVRQVHDAVKEGEAIASSLGATKIFPNMVVSMMEVGEETGKLPEMLEKISSTYEEEVDMAVEALTSMIEPLMIITLALVVGTIVIALFMPLIILIERIANV